jgi:hypothetical protein
MSQDSVREAYMTRLLGKYSTFNGIHPVPLAVPVSNAPNPAPVPGVPNPQPAPGDHSKSIQATVELQRTMSQFTRNNVSQVLITQLVHAVHEELKLMTNLYPKPIVAPVLSNSQPQTVFFQAPLSAFRH